MFVNIGTHLGIYYHKGVAEKQFFFKFKIRFFF